MKAAVDAKVLTCYSQADEEDSGVEPPENKYTDQWRSRPMMHVMWVQWTGPKETCQRTARQMVWRFRTMLLN